MRRIKLYVFAVIAVLVIGAGALFYLQNADTQVVLFLHLGFWTGQLSTPWPVPLLMLASFAAGLGLMGIYTVFLQLRRGSRGPASSRASTRGSGRGKDDAYDDIDF